MSTLEMYVAAKPEYGAKRKAKITKIHEATAKEIFGTKARNADQTLIVVDYMAEGDAAGRLTFDKPAGRAIEGNTSLARFMNKYGGGKLPIVGTEIHLLANEQGRWKPVT